MARDSRFDHFDGWAAGYFACSVSPENRVQVIEYIKNQIEHHLNYPTDEEVKRLYLSANIEYDERDMK